MAMGGATPLSRLDQTARGFLPVITVILLGIIAVLPIGIPQWGALAPPLMLIASFIGSLVRPDLMPPTAAFALGLLQDFLSGAPIGSGALIMVVTQWTMRGQQRFLANRPFLLLWGSFIPVAFVAAMLEWGVYALLNLHAVPIMGALVRLMLGFALFPVVAWLVLIPTHSKLPPE